MDVPEYHMHISSISSNVTISNAHTRCVTSRIQYVFDSSRRNVMLGSYDCLKHVHFQSRKIFVMTVYKLFFSLYKNVQLKPIAHILQYDFLKWVSLWFWEVEMCMAVIDNSGSGCVYTVL